MPTFGSSVAAITTAMSRPWSASTSRWSKRPARGSRGDVIVGPETSPQITRKIREKLHVVHHHDDDRSGHTGRLAVAVREADDPGDEMNSQVPGGG
jgi:hypothetical protein